jgi:hypothetical protein
MAFLTVQVGVVKNGPCDKGKEVPPRVAVTVITMN